MTLVINPVKKELSFCISPCNGHNDRIAIEESFKSLEKLPRCVKTFASFWHNSLLLNDSHTKNTVIESVQSIQGFQATLSIFISFTLKTRFFKILLGRPKCPCNYDLDTKRMHPISETYSYIHR